MSARPIRTSKSTLYWSHLKAYEDCPRQFLWGYGWEGVDLGSGVGNPKQKPAGDSQHHAFLGSLIQKVLEDYTNQEMWEHPLGLGPKLKALTRQYYDELQDKYVFTKLSPSRQSLLKEADSSVQAYPFTARAHDWNVPGSKSEVKLVSSLKGISVGARIDFVIPDSESAILLDGKNTQHRMKHTDPDQLRYYHLVYELATGKAPTKLGLVWFRFPYTDGGEPGVDWVPCTDRDLQGMSDRIKRAYLSMVKGEFDPKPVPKKCSFCAFEAVCPERQEQRMANAAKKKASSKKKEVHLPMLGQGWFSAGVEGE